MQIKIISELRNQFSTMVLKTWCVKYVLAKAKCTLGGSNSGLDSIDIIP